MNDKQEKLFDLIEDYGIKFQVFGERFVNFKWGSEIFRLYDTGTVIPMTWTLDTRITTDFLTQTGTYSEVGVIRPTYVVEYMTYSYGFTDFVGYKDFINYLSDQERAQKLLDYDTFLGL